MLARQSGAHKIIVSELNPLRREAALKAGADLVIDPTTDDLKSITIEATQGLGVDVAICAIGLPVLINDAVCAVRSRGRISLFAGFSAGVKAELDVNAIHYNELSVMGSFGLTRRHFENALHLLASRTADFGWLITHRYPLEKISEAFAMAEHGQAIKVAISGN